MSLLSDAYAQNYSDQTSIAGLCFTRKLVFKTAIDPKSNIFIPAILVSLSTPMPATYGQHYQQVVTNPINSGFFSLLPGASAIHPTHLLLTVSDELYLLAVTMVTLLASPHVASAVFLAAKRKRTPHGLGSRSLALKLVDSDCHSTRKLLNSVNSARKSLVAKIIKTYLLIFLN